MKEKIGKKEIARRIFGVILAVAMVVALMPMNSLTVYADGEPTWVADIISKVDEAASDLVTPVEGEVWSLSFYLELDDISSFAGYMDLIDGKNYENNGLVYTITGTFKPLPPVSFPATTTIELDSSGQVVRVNIDRNGNVASFNKNTPTHTHGSWDYSASGATLTAECKATTGTCDLDDGNGAHKVSLTLTASDMNYSDISGLSAFNDATGLGVNTSDVKFYTVTTEGATTGGTGETSTAPTADGYYYASLTVAGKTAVKAFTIGNPGGGSKPDPKPTPSKSEVAAAPTIPTDYVAERVAEEEAMDITLVTIDTTQYSKNEESVVPGTSYNLSKFITTKGIVKGIKTAVAAANNDKKDTVEIYTGKPFCFNKEIIKTIQESKKTVVYYFQYKGHVYSVTVPATVDASKVLEKAGFAGPLYVGQQLGTTKLVK